ncbi:hypothetical protein KUTeg_022182 [Tegillarca granosa]|uniref:Uncharacterized protein n=1 Tax=Tegillarca granosa TaxID=220873 RepID=A0ABQ9E5G8_TEGGR|nr:hypothetical protein KUTeg_022182 [Tegillarca granosa]
MIKNTERIGDLHSSFNFTISNSFTVKEKMEKAYIVYDKQMQAFRLNVIFGVILRNVETDEYRYFKPVENDFFNFPLYITKRKHLKKLEACLQKMDINTHLLNQRPNTKWKPVLITYVNVIITLTTFVVCRLTYHKLRSVNQKGFERKVKSFNLFLQNFLYQNEIKDIRNISEKILLKINIDIFELYDSNKAEIRYKLLCEYKDHMFLNIYETFILHN